MYCVLLCIFFMCLLVLAFQSNKQIESRITQYDKSAKLLVENPDDFVRREAFFKDAYAYHNALYVSICHSPMSEMPARMRTLKYLTQNRMDRYMSIGLSTNIGSNYYLSKSLVSRDNVSEIKRKVLSICSRKQLGASIIDIIVELREDRIEVMPVLEQLREERLIVANNNAYGVLYKTC